MTEIPYPKRSRFLSPIERSIKDSKSELLHGRGIAVSLSPPKGYNGKISVTVRPNDPKYCWTDRTYSDVTRFPQRIRVAAWALFRQRCFGTFEIAHDSGDLTIRRLS
jgi:hypothetical protein